MQRSDTSDIDSDTEECSALLVLGQLAYKHSEYKEAIEHFNNALKIDPEYAELYYHRACAYRDQGGYDKLARLDFIKAKDLGYPYNAHQKEYIEEFGAAIDAATSRNLPRIAVTAPISRRPGAPSTKPRALDPTLKPKASSTLVSQGHDALFVRVPKPSRDAIPAFLERERTNPSPAASAPSPEPRRPKRR